MVDQEVIDTIKSGVDLIALVESRGIHLKKNGKSYHGLCPFHDDKNPSLSINPDKNLWQCFGCGAAGDVIRFVEMFDKVDFPEAVGRLSVISDQLSVDRKKPTSSRQQTATLSVKDRKLLARVVSYYQHTLGGEDHRGIDYLKKERGITDNQTLTDFLYYTKNHPCSNPQFM